MTSPLERAARIIAGPRADEMVQAGNPIGEPCDYPAWMLCLPDARSILEALREPSEGMVAAVSDMSLMDNNPTQDWQAMIDAALSEGG